MGMTANENKGPFSDPNIVPFIDVLLVLIIIFMVITPRVPTGLPTLIPHADMHSTTPEPSTIVVQVMYGGKLMINQEHCDWNTLGTRLWEIFKTRADKIAFVKSAGEVPFSQIARAIDIMRGAGIEHIGLMTQGG